METETGHISNACRKRLHVQGYDNLSDKELSDFKYGIRFAYAGCITLVAFGLYSQSVQILAIAFVVAFAAVFPPYHPFDYIYNYGVRHLIRKPKMPPRTDQGRFACGIASVWLAVTIYLIYTDQILLANIFGIVLFAVGALVAMIDICIPSMIYNFIFKRLKKSN